MKPAQIARYKLPHRSQPCREFLIVLRQRHLETVCAPDANLLHQPQNMGDQPVPGRCKRQLFNQSPQMPQALPQHPDHLHRNLRMGRTQTLKMRAGRRSKIVRVMAIAVVE